MKNQMFIPVMDQETTEMSVVHWSFSDLKDLKSLSGRLESLLEDGNGDRLCRVFYKDGMAEDEWLSALICAEPFRLYSLKKNNPDKVGDVF